MRAVFISNIPSPYQIRFNEAIKNMEMTFIYCDDITKDRPKYWQINRGDKNIILNNRKRIILFKSRYINLDIKDKLNQLNPDIVMLGGFSIPTNLMAYHWAKKKNKKVVVFTEISTHKNRINLYRILYSKINAILAVGNKAVEQYKSFFKSTPIYHFSYAGALDERFTIKRSYTNNEIIFLYASRYIKNYNAPMLINAFCELSKKYANTKLIMSSNGPLEKKCKNLVKDLKLNDKIIFRDDLKSWDEVNDLYALADILVFPASFNSWGQVIPEAMASAMPIITTPYVMGSELLDKKNLVEPTQIELFKAMERFILDPSEIKRQGETNREMCNSETFESKSQQLKRIFTEVLEECK